MGAPRGPAAPSSRCTARGSTASSTRRRPWPTARARCCGSRAPVAVVARPAVGDRRRAGAAPARTRQHHRRSLLRRAVARAVGGGHHRHQWQDHLRLSTGAGARSRRPARRLHGHHRHRAPARAHRERAHHRRCGDRAAHAGAACSADGAASVAMEVSSHAHRPGARRRGAFPHRGVHQSHARSSRLSRHHGELWRRQGEAVHARRPGVARDQCRRRLRPRSSPSIRAAAAGSSSPAAATSRSARSAAGFVRAMHVELSTRGIELEFDSSWGTGALISALVGDFNVDNLLTVIAILLDWELRLAQVIAGAGARACRARAHGNIRRRPCAARDRRLRAHARCAAQGAGARHARIAAVASPWCSAAAAIAIAGKRPMMGAIAAELADDIVITDDNPRSEPPQAIAAGHRRGHPGGQAVSHRTRSRARHSRSADRCATRATWC